MGVELRESLGHARQPLLSLNKAGDWPGAERIVHLKHSPPLGSLRARHREGPFLL